jgi:hypothetical protein
MSIIALSIFILLTAIAGLHVGWGAGVLWPCKTEAELTSTVVGYRRDKMPAPNHCYLAALAIYIPGTIALMLAGLIDVSVTASTVPLAGAFAALVFIGRGMAGYVPAWRARFPREPFATLDRYYYSPLCLLLAAGFVVLLINFVSK